MPMSAALSSRTRAHDGPALAARFAAVRAESCRIAAAVSAEDCAAQSMPDASPLKWHLAHTSWFFERFLLREQVADYPVFDPHYEYLFNSYYDSVGPRHARAERGLLTRPPLAEVLRYRSHVDAWMLRLLDTLEPGTAAADLVELGINHEQQHQELMFTDIKHLLSRNPLEPAYRRDLAAVPASRSSLRWIGVEGGLSEIGAEPAAGFCFDNELPRHRVWLEPFQLASRAVTNGEYREFVARRRLRRAPALARRRLGLGPAGGLEPPAVLVGGTGLGVHSWRAPRAGPGGPGVPRQLLRGGGVRALGRRAPAHRSGVGMRGGDDAASRQFRRQ